MKIEREVKRQLKKPADARPPSELLDSIKTDIPEDLFGPAIQGSSVGDTAERFRLLPVAASVMTLALVGILAVAVYRQGLPMESVSPAAESSSFELAETSVPGQSEAPESIITNDAIGDEQALGAIQSPAAAETRVFAQLGAEPNLAEVDEIAREESPVSDALFEASAAPAGSSSENEQIARKEDDLRDGAAGGARPATPRPLRVAAESQRVPEPQVEAAELAVSDGERDDADLSDLAKASREASELKQSPRQASARRAPSTAGAPAELEPAPAKKAARARNAVSESQFDERSTSASKPKVEELAQDVAAPAPAVRARPQFRTDSRSQGARRIDELELRRNLERTLEESVPALGVRSLRLEEARDARDRDTPAVRVRAQLLAGYGLEIALADGTWQSLEVDTENAVDQTIPRARLALNAGQKILDLRTFNESGARFQMLQRIQPPSEQP